MERDLEALFRQLGIRESEQETFARCLNRLLGETFIVREFDREDYYFIQRHREAIKTYLNAAQWDLLEDPLERAFQAINRQGRNRRNLKRLETELILMFAISYLEQSRELSLTRLPVFTMADIYPRYQSLFGTETRLTRTPLEEALNTLRRYRLIVAPDGKQLLPTNADQKFLLLPTLLMVLEVEKLEEITVLLQKYTVAEDGPDDNNEDDE